MGFINGLGAEAFGDNFLKAYLGMNRGAEERENNEVARTLHKQQIEEYLNKQKMREEMAALIQNNNTPYFQGDEMTPAGQQKLQGMMQPAIQQGVQSQNDYMPPGTNAPDMAQGMTPGLMANLRAQGGEQRPLKVDQLLPILAKYDPEKAATILANKDKWTEGDITKFLLLDKKQGWDREKTGMLEGGRNDRNEKNNATRIEIKGMGNSGGSGSDGTWQYIGTTEDGLPKYFNNKTREEAIGASPINAKPKSGSEDKIDKLKGALNTGAIKTDFDDATVAAQRGLSGKEVVLRLRQKGYSDAQIEQQLGARGWKLNNIKKF